MRIGPVEIKGKTALAPLAGITDIPFRMACKESGTNVVFSEMVSSEGLVRGSERSNRYLKFLEEERPIALQLFGSDPDIMARASQIVEKRNPDFIDINFGCPVKKIVKNDAGSALLKDPPRMGKIVNAMVKSVSIPVAAKIRSGWDENSMPVSDIGKILEDNGVSVITIHARTRQMLFNGRAQWSEICRLKEAVSVPVIGNGDVSTPEDARRMFEETECDMVMIGRGALGNPWIFRDINHYLESGEILPGPSYMERISMCLKQMNVSMELYGSAYTANALKKHCAWYLKGLPNSTAVKAEIFKVQDYEQMVETLLNFKDYLADNFSNGECRKRDAR